MKDYQVKLVVRDEDQYGCGEESSFQFAFFDELRKRIPNMRLLSVSATPYDILDAHFRIQADVEVIEGVRTPTYYGITEMLQDGIIDDLPINFRPLQENGDENQIHPYVEKYINHLLSFKSGLGIIRESNTMRAIELRDLIKERFKKQPDVLVIGSNSVCDFGINEGLNEVKNRILRQGRRVILIVVQALSAGKDLGKLKEKVRFGIETRDQQLANGVQGITGRCCGYHSNRSFKIIAGRALLEHYAKFEQDWEIFSDPDWRAELYDNEVKGLTTQTKFNISQKAGMFIPINVTNQLSIEELKTVEGRENLHFLDDNNYQKLMSFFNSELFEYSTKGMRLNAPDTTIRLASSYQLKDNRVYKNWSADTTKDFGNVFFKKEEYKFGILIPNYPINHPKNILIFVVLRFSMPVIQRFANENWMSVTNQCIMRMKENLLNFKYPLLCPNILFFCCCYFRL